MPQVHCALTSKLLRPAVDDVLRVLARGSANRHIGETKMNKESSRQVGALALMNAKKWPRAQPALICGTVSALPCRSHVVLTCTVESRAQEDGATTIRRSQLHLVDLAGSERQKSAETEGDRLKEAAAINKWVGA